MLSSASSDSSVSSASTTVSIGLGFDFTSSLGEAASLRTGSDFPADGVVVAAAAGFAKADPPKVALGFSSVSDKVKSVSAVLYSDAAGARVGFETMGSFSVSAATLAGAAGAGVGATGAEAGATGVTGASAAGTGMARVVAVGAGTEVARAGIGGGGGAGTRGETGAAATGGTAGTGALTSGTSLRVMPMPVRRVLRACSRDTGLVRTRLAPKRNALGTPALPSTMAMAMEVLFKFEARALLKTWVAFCALSQSTRSRSKRWVDRRLRAKGGSLECSKLTSNSSSIWVTA